MNLDQIFEYQFLWTGPKHDNLQLLLPNQSAILNVPYFFFKLTFKKDSVQSKKFEHGQNCFEVADGLGMHNFSF